MIAFFNWEKIKFLEILKIFVPYKTIIYFFLKILLILFEQPNNSPPTIASIAEFAIYLQPLRQYFANVEIFQESILQKR